MQGLYFYAFKYFQAEARKRVPIGEENSLHTAASNLACGAAAGSCVTILTNPIWMIKARLQLQGREVTDTSRQYRGLIDAFVRIYREEGVRTYFRGIGPALLLVSNGALQFMVPWALSLRACLCSFVCLSGV